MIKIGNRLAVFSIRSGQKGNIWVRAGSAFVNKDGSLNVLLDVLPLDGKLHVREPSERKPRSPGADEARPSAPSPAGEPLEPRSSQAMLLQAETAVS